MKALVYEKYGSPDVLQLKEVEKPSPRDNEVLVKIQAGSVNSWDWDLLRGKPFLNRLGGFLTPKHKVLGCDISGYVDAVGKNVKKFKPGNAVLGDLSGCGFGGFAEFACTREDALILKSTGMTFEQAAAIPQAGLLALQGLCDKGHLRKGQKVLINGAGGGAGTFAVQIAKSYGAEVIAVDSTGKLEMLRSIGADHIIDYMKEDFVKSGRQYDLIVATAGYRSIFDYRRALSSKGIYVCTGGSMRGPKAMAQVYQALLFGPLLSRKRGKKMGSMLAKPNQKDLVFMKELIEGEKVKPIIDKYYPLKESPEALRYYEQGHARGKVVIVVQSQT